MSDGSHSSLAACAMLAVVLGPGCGDQPSAPPIVWEGTTVRFGTDADASGLCAGTLPYLDGVAGYLGQTFGRSDVQLDYYWTPEGTEPYCADGAEGCSNDQGVFSRFPIHQHEMVHGVRRPSLLYQPFEEGLAEAYGDDWDPAYGIDGDLVDILSHPDRHFPGDGYGPMGHFVSYLRATRGVDPLVELDLATEFESTFVGTQAAFEAVFGEPLEDAIATYTSDYPRCDLRSYRDKTFDCSRNVVSAPTELEESLDLVIPMGCDEPTVMGPRFGHRWTTVTLDVEQGGRYHVAAFPEVASGLELIHVKQCESSCFEYADDIINRTTGTQLGGGACLEPGRYLFRFEIDQEVTDDYRLIVTRTDPSCG